MSPAAATSGHPRHADDRRLAPRERLVASVVAAGAAAPLAIAWRLEPSAEGVGTHQQLGLPACGWMAGMNLPCPSCGMTTSFSRAVRGDLLGAVQAQPMGALLAVAAAVAVIVAIFTAATGSRSYELLGSLFGRRGVWTVVALCGLAWAYKVAAVRLGEGSFPGAGPAAW